MLSHQILPVLSPMKSAAILIVTIIVSACAGTPPANHNVSAPAATPPVAKATPTNTADKGESLLALQRQGYTIVDKNGERYYCRDEKKTGSRLAHETVCMTQKEMDDLRDRTQHNMGNFMREVPPPQGK